MDRSPYGCGGTFIIVCVLFIAWAVDGCATACNPKAKVPEKVPDIEEITIIKYN